MTEIRRRLPASRLPSGVLLCLLLGACVATPRAGPPAPAAASRPAAAASAPEAQPAPPPGLTIAAVGDIMLGTDYPQNILPDDDGVGFLREVTPLLAAADVAVGNLEGVLQDGGEPVKRCGSSTSCYVFRSPTRYAQYLRDAGFDAMSLANNHASDFGEAGRESTMQALDAVGIRHSGREGDVASWAVRGTRVALIAFAPNVGAHQLNDLPHARELVRSLAADHAVVIVSFHGGAEGDGAEHLPFARETFHGEDRGDVVEFAHAMVESGADLVLGHGPHVARPLELYRDRLIAYSLGNFATYYGIKVEGIRGLAPLLIARLDEDGRFLEGRIESTIQVRPGGPQPDPQRRVLELIRTLTETAFPNGALAIGPEGQLAPASEAAPAAREPPALSLR